MTVAIPEAGTTTDHEAETVLLSVPPTAHDAPRTAPRRARPRGRKRGARRPILILTLIFVGAFTAVKVASYLNSIDDNPPDATRVAAPVPDASAPDADSEPDSPPATSTFLSARLEAFRAALDASGYGSVRFRMVGDTMVLTGTVPTATDEAMVQMLAMNIAGVASLKDHMQVRNGIGGP